MKLAAEALEAILQGNPQLVFRKEQVAYVYVTPIAQFYRLPISAVVRLVDDARDSDKIKNLLGCSRIACLETELKQLIE